MDWDNYRAFLEVYRSGDLGHAAQGLEMSVPTVRRRLDAVESHIGFSLFERTPRGLSPTPIARRLVHSIAAMGDSAAVAGSLKEGPAQSVSISADDDLAYYLSDVTWADLRRSHPGLGISVATRRPHSDHFEIQADVAISHVRPKAERGAGRCTDGLEVGLFAHRDYLAHAGVPEDLADLQRACMVAAESDEANAWLEARLGLAAGSTRSAFRTDSYAGRLAAIEAGAGIGICYVDLAKRRLDLVRVLPKVSASLECWVWSPGSQLRGGVANRVIESLVASLSEPTGSTARVRTARPGPSTLDKVAA
jgi:DNA-binding transcriptional LysR family regulator